MIGSADPALRSELMGKSTRNWFLDGLASGMIFATFGAPVVALFLGLHLVVLIAFCATCALVYLGIQAVLARSGWLSEPCGVKRRTQ